MAESSAGAPYRTKYYDKIKTRKGHGNFRKTFYNLRDMASVGLQDEIDVLSEMWQSIHEDFAMALAPGENDVLTVPFLLDQCYYYPYAVMTKSVKERPAKYTMYPHLKHFVSSDTRHMLQPEYEMRDVKEEFEFERAGLTGFGWDNPKGGAVLRVKCKNVREVTVVSQPPNVIRLRLDLLNNDLHYLEQNVGERLYMVSKVFFADEVKVDAILTTVDDMFDSDKYDEGREHSMRFETKFDAESHSATHMFGFPLAYSLQKIALQTKKSFKEGTVNQNGYLMEKIDVCDNTKFKKEGLWMLRDYHPLDEKEEEEQKAALNGLMTPGLTGSSNTMDD